MTKSEYNALVKIQSKVRGILERKRHKERLEEQIKIDYLRMNEKVNYIRDLTQLQSLNDNSTNEKSIKTDTAFSFLKASSSFKTHKKTNSISTEMSRSTKTPKFLKNYKYQAKSIKYDELFMFAKKSRSFNNNLGFFYSKKELNVLDHLRNSPLYYAAKNTNLDFCEYLLENGANLNEICSLGETPFHIAMRTNKTEVTKSK